MQLFLLAPLSVKTAAVFLRFFFLRHTNSSRRPTPSQHEHIRAESRNACKRRWQARSNSRKQHAHAADKRSSEPNACHGQKAHTAIAHLSRFLFYFCSCWLDVVPAVTITLFTVYRSEGMLLPTVSIALLLYLKVQKEKKEVHITLRLCWRVYV